jgi:lipoprotein NlpD
MLKLITKGSPISTSWALAPLLLVCLALGACETGIYHTVQPGQTLYRISRTYGVDEDYLARLNGIADPAQLQSGSRLFVPGAQGVRSVPVVAADSPAGSTKKRPPPTQKVTRPAKVSKAEGKSPPSVQDSGAATAVKKLQWPLKGQILRTFSEQARTGAGKGIEIAARSGSIVTAAEAGKVIYSGDGVNGYGYLVILQHENDFYTIYGFNKKNLVKQGDYVSRGERVALSGTPPAGGSSRLHFEVRKGKQAVNPILYLP